MFGGSFDSYLGIRIKHLARGVEDGLEKKIFAPS